MYVLYACGHRVGRFDRLVRVLLLRYQAQLAGTAGGRGRENRTENEIEDDETAAAEPSTATGAAAAAGQDRHRHRRQSRYRRKDRTEEADQLGADTRQQRQ